MWCFSIEVPRGSRSSVQVPLREAVKTQTDSFSRLYSRVVLNIFGREIQKAESTNETITETSDVVSQQQVRDVFLIPVRRHRVSKQFCDDTKKE